jgi:hypothetical protein
MKTIILFIIFLSSIAWSQDYVMHVKKDDGSTTSINIQDIRKITFTTNPNGINDFIRSKIKFTLSQNYPNPFNPSTNIVYEVPEKGMISVKVYNMLGQEVRTLFRATQNAGKHTIIWDGRNNNGGAVSSGMYVYRIDFKGKALAKKMLMLK